jgi:hypothetical protein
LGRAVNANEVSPRIAAHLGELFALELRTADRDALEVLLRTHEEQPAGMTASRMIA